MVIDVSVFMDNFVVVESKEDKLHSEAKTIVLKTGCRAIDAYYIATAKLINTILITNDSIMERNADKA